MCFIQLQLLTYSSSSLSEDSRVTTVTRLRFLRVLLAPLSRCIIASWMPGSWREAAAVT
jgi:hypothetical protein